MPDTNAARRRFKRVLIALIAVCVIALAVLLSPIGTSFRHQQQQLDQLRSELRAKSLENQPLRGIDRKVIDAQHELDAFYSERLPSSFASVSESLSTAAAKNGVRLVTSHYKAEPSGVPGLQHLEIEASISGDYLHAVKFINATERDKTFFLVDRVGLTQQQGGIVQLQIRIEAFLKDL